MREYLIRTRPQLWRKEVYKLSMGICGGCREVFDYYEDDGWEADHIIPLFVAHALGDWTAWDPSTNGQVLCLGCHKDKTAADFKKYGSAKYVREWAAANRLPD